MYKIANLIIDIYNMALNKEIWKKFVYSKSCKANIKIAVYDTIKTKYNLEKVILQENMKECYRFRSEIMFVNQMWTEIEILSPVHSNDIDTFVIQIFNTHAVQRHMIQLHSSLINYREKGILFLGPSGIGKTTQAELWNKYRDALIINGDMVFVQETEDGFLGWGTPWHGSSPYCENASVPIHAMIVLKQSPDNSIRELTGFEKVTTVSNSVFYPQWLENGMELCLETLDHLLTKVPVYELSCRPDEEAVTLTEQFIF